jgi:crotonobetainyl-CoA:carnitine CoA-transferase CaiB-like acyl-CoA transferase
MSAGVLDDVLVVDFSTMMSGPYCTRLLADMGADVVKIEAPGGEYMRVAAPRRDGASTYFGQLNAGKRSVVLDLRSRAGLDAALKLIARADVVVENFRPGVAARAGIDYESCAALRPGLVYCSVSGFGQDGPYADRAAYAAVVHAASGYDLATMHYGDTASPAPCGVQVGDALGGAVAFGAILAALRRRDRTGEGSHVDVSMFEAMLSMLVYELQSAQFGRLPAPSSFRPVRTSDGFIVAAIVTDANWIALATAMDRPELAADERFATASARFRNDAALYELLDSWASVRRAEDAEAALLAAGVPATRYRTLSEQFDDPHVRAREFLRAASDRAGDFRIAATPFRLDGRVTPNEGAHAPALGEHTRDVLTTIAGLRDDEIDALIAR